MRTIFIGNDHRGFPLVSGIRAHIEELGFPSVHIGCHNTDSHDYPRYAQSVAELVQKNPDAMGILVCGSGIGVCIAANRFDHVRAATCRSMDDAEMTRKHNDANILCLGADVDYMTDIETTVVMNRLVETFLTTRFEGGRHQRRIDLIDGGEIDDLTFTVG